MTEDETGKRRLGAESVRDVESAALENPTNDHLCGLSRRCRYRPGGDGHGLARSDLPVGYHGATQRCAVRIDVARAATCRSPEPPGLVSSDVDPDTSPELRRDAADRTSEFLGQPELERLPRLVTRGRYRGGEPNHLLPGHHCPTLFSASSTRLTSRRRVANSALPVDDN